MLVSGLGSSGVLFVVREIGVLLEFIEGGVANNAAGQGFVPFQGVRAGAVAACRQPTGGRCSGSW